MNEKKPEDSYIITDNKSHLYTRILNIKINHALLLQ